VPWLPQRLRILSVILVPILAVIAPACAQPATTATLQPTGTVLPSVKLLADSSHSYALYLPAGYSSQKRWPLLLAFDPEGVGSNPVKLFQQAAGKYGFIVVGSNNSRNFIDPSLTIRLLWSDVTSRYSIDPRRIYATGFSGGSRVAAGLAIGCKNCLAGVIACGAGLPPGTSLPSPEMADWFITVGRLDFNYAEMIRLADALHGRHAATHLVFFPGPHSWMPPAVAEEALAWITLRAIARGTTPADKEFIEHEFKRATAAAEALRQSDGALATFRAYRQIIHDFAGLYNIRNIQEQEDALASSAELKRARKAEKALFDLQDSTAASIVSLTNTFLSQEKPSADVFRDLEALTGQIRHERDTLKDVAQHDALTRGLAGGLCLCARIRLRSLAQE
jgi:dienelactone hydrolase